MAEAASVVLKCPNCDFTAKNKGGLTRHINSKHGDKASRRSSVIDDGAAAAVDSPPPSEIVKSSPVRGMKKVKQITDSSYLRLPDSSPPIIYNFKDREKHNKTKLDKVKSKIASIHQILWSREQMVPENTLDEIMKLLFLKYLQNIISDTEEPDKIDLFNPKYHTDVFIDKNEFAVRDYHFVKKYLTNFNSIGIEMKSAYKVDTAKVLQIYNPIDDTDDLFKRMLVILNKHPTTKGIYPPSSRSMLLFKYPETLMEVLQILNDPIFETNDVEDMIGEIYEYFINNYVKKKSKLGQYFTPRGLMDITLEHFKTRFATKLSNFQYADVNIGDRCMGTGGWLVKFYNTFKTIRHDIKLHGCEIQSNTYQYGLINMISTTSGYPYDPLCGNALIYIPEFKLFAIFSNPPFSASFNYKLLKQEYEKFYKDIQTEVEQGKCARNYLPKFEDIYFLKDEENTPLQFLQLYIYMLAIGGIGFIVLPYGELFYGDGKMSKAREEIMKRISITDIIICPPGIFTHTEIKVCMMVFEKLADGNCTSNIQFSKFILDGNKELTSIQSITRIAIDDINKQPNKSWYHTDYLIDGKIHKLQLDMPQYEWVEFGEVFDLVKGTLQSSEVEEDPDGDGVFVTKAKKTEWRKIKDCVIDGDNLFIAYAGNNIGRTEEIPIRYNTGKCNFSNLMFYCRNKNTYTVNIKYIYYYLLSIQKHIDEIYQKGSCNQSLDVANFYRMKIPIPSIEIQSRIITRIDDSKIKITGLENIVDMMKTKDIPFTFWVKFELLRTHPDMKWIPFGEVFDLVKGTLQSTKVEEDPDGDGVLINLSLYNDYKKINNSELDGDNLFISTTMSAGPDEHYYSVIKFYSGKCSYCDTLSRVIIKKDYLLSINLKFMEQYLNYIKKHIDSTYERGSCNKSLDLANFYRMPIPIPPKSCQDEIADEITAIENMIVRWNKDIEYLKSKDNVNCENLLAQ